MGVAKGEKLGFFGGLKRWFRLVMGELKKVHWPTKKEVSIYTVVVLVAVVLVGLGIWIIDSGISYLVKLILQ
ncbi:MAG: preprotein translocase subunit SecE [Peptococcia bacterium]|jgi:preprotein translocase subunit SecE